MSGKLGKLPLTAKSRFEWEEGEEWSLGGSKKRGLTLSATHINQRESARSDKKLAPCING